MIRTRVGTKVRAVIQISIGGGGRLARIFGKPAHGYLNSRANGNRNLPT